MGKWSSILETMVVDAKFWSNKNVLITGHTGFKGSWLSLWLEKLGANVYGLSLEDLPSYPNLFSILDFNKKISDFRGDITSSESCIEAIKKASPDIIFHLAAQPLVRISYKDPMSTYNTNVMGTVNILEAARRCGSIKTIISITTDKCYENIEQDYAYVETDPLGGYDPYSSSKACAEHIASAYYRSFFKEKAVGLATARAGNVIGGGDWSSDRLIPDAVRAWSNKEKLIIRNPLAIRPWQYVLEALAGYMLLAMKVWNDPNQFSGAWNFGPDQTSIKTVNDTLEIAMKEWGNGASWELSKDSHPHEAKLLQLDSEKANSLLTWKPKMDCSESIIETLSWYKKYYDNKNMREITLKQIQKYEKLI
jgi:CDP-glucose 4,6-dehydratase